MKPSQRYRALTLQSGFQRDPEQQEAIALLDALYDRLTAANGLSWWQRLRSPEGTRVALEGLYFWGGVGRGKTLLMDLLYHSLPAQVRARRCHFHEFMNEIHHALGRLQNTGNPLQRVARDISTRVRVICLDEFVIIDIADAMIMSALLKALFEQGVLLVTTSNAAPENLYKDGLQRRRFLPAIDLISKYCKVINLDGGSDYRLQFLRATALYSVPHSIDLEADIQRYLDEHVKPLQAEKNSLQINARYIEFLFCADDTIWFSFAQLCETARSQYDYLELAQRFNTLILTDVRQMGARDDDTARRFVLLIDVLYDHRVKLICSAAADPTRLYQGKRLAFEFERSASRLIEMQSESYLAGAHWSGRQMSNQLPVEGGD